MRKSVKRIYDLFTGLLVAIVVILAFALVGVRLLGLNPFVVLSGSMEPTYHVGSLIYVKEVEDPRALPDGTVITYMISEDTVVTHRIVTAVPDEDDPTVIRYRTKGDANDAEDGTLLHYKNIIGTPVFAVPKLGYLASYIQNPPGSYMAMCIGAIFILLLFLPELLGVFFEKEEPVREEKKSRRKGKSKARTEEDYSEEYVYDPAYDEMYPPAEDDYYAAEDWWPEEDYAPSAEEARPVRETSRRRGKGGAHCK